MALSPSLSLSLPLPTVLRQTCLFVKKKEKKEKKFKHTKQRNSLEDSLGWVETATESDNKKKDSGRKPRESPG